MLEPAGWGWGGGGGGEINSSVTGQTRGLHVIFSTVLVYLFIVLAAAFQFCKNITQISSCFLFFALAIKIDLGVVWRKKIGDLEKV